MIANIIKGSKFNYLLATNIAKQNWQPVLQNKVEHLYKQIVHFRKDNKQHISSLLSHLQASKMEKYSLEMYL
jgi:Glu-tRNA(Gln) amidotransferase subunit E-like FAD-binding protein